MVDVLRDNNIQKLIKSSPNSVGNEIVWDAFRSENLTVGQLGDLCYEREAPTRDEMNYLHEKVNEN